MKLCSHSKAKLKLRPMICLRLITAIIEISINFKTLINLEELLKILLLEIIKVSSKKETSILKEKSFT